MHKFIRRLLLLVLVLIVTGGVLLWYVGLPVLRTNMGELLWAGRQHLRLVFSSMALALLVGVPVGVLLSRHTMSRVADYLIQIVNIGNTLPTMAVLALAMMLVGIGDKPAITALFLASLLPIVQNSYAGLRAVPAALREAAKGMGMTQTQCLWRVELPYAWPVILAGIRTATTINVGTAPLAFLIGASGYGELIFPGIYLNDSTLLLLGASATALTALVLDMALAGLRHLFSNAEFH